MWIKAAAGPLAVLGSENLQFFGTVKSTDFSAVLIILVNLETDHIYFFIFIFYFLQRVRNLPFVIS